MRYSYTHYVLALLICCSVTLTAQQPVKRVLLEQYTGAWCGWCVDGSVVMDELIKEFPDNVIGVKVHQGDAMEIPKVFDSIKTLVPFYPSGSIDRVTFPGEATVGTSREKWKEYVQMQMKKGSDIDVKVTNVSFDKSTRILKANVEATFVKSMSGDLRLNLMIIEDNVKGTGTGYDQSNYISANPSFKGHPYFDKPAKIVGYEHRSVVRSYPAGVWGIKNSIPAIASTGEKYTASFTYTVPADYDEGNLMLVGVVQKHGAAVTAREILNSYQVGLLKPVAVESEITGQFQQTKLMGNSESKLTMKNINEEAVTVSYEVDPVASLIPKGWKASVSKATETLEPGASGDVMVTVSGDDTPGFAKIIVNAVVTSQNLAKKTFRSKIYALSPLVKHVVYGSHAKMNELYLNDLESIKPRATAQLPMDAEVLSGYPPSMFDLAIISVDNENAGLIANNGALLNGIASMLQAGKKVFIASEQEISTILKSENAAIKSLLGETLGISVKAGSPVKRFEQDKNSGDILMAYPVVLNGKAGDYVSRDVKATLNEYFEDPVLTPFTRFTDVFALSQGSLAVPIFHYDDNSVDIAAIRWEANDSRLVLFGFGLDGISNKTKRSQIMSRTYNWLLNGALSVDESESLFKSIQPNPASDIATVEYIIEKPSQFVKISVLDALGRQIHEIISQHAIMGKHSVSIPVSELPIGKYQVKIDGASSLPQFMPLVIVR
ncbi:MAG: Omp28-related outer membrane protein [bacterium]